MGGGNQLTILKNAGGTFQGLEITNLLKKMGFKKEEVVELQENVFRPSQIEVTLEKDVELDLEKMEKKIKEKMLPYTVAKFSYCEEVLMVYGLPFTQDIGKMKEELRDSVRAFV